MSTYMGLFTYKVVKVNDTGEILFGDISLMRVFPDEDFVLGKCVSACVNPSSGNIFLYNNIDDVSKIIPLNEWTHRISRTD